MGCVAHGQLEWPARMLIREGAWMHVDAVFVLGCMQRARKALSIRHIDRVVGAAPCFTWHVIFHAVFM